MTFKYTDLINGNLFLKKKKLDQIDTSQKKNHKDNKHDKRSIKFSLTTDFRGSNTIWCQTRNIFFLASMSTHHQIISNIIQSKLFSIWSVNSTNSLDLTETSLLPEIMCPAFLLKNLYSAALCLSKRRSVLWRLLLWRSSAHNIYKDTIHRLFVPTCEMMTLTSKAQPFIPLWSRFFKWYFLAKLQIVFEIHIIICKSFLTIFNQIKQHLKTLETIFSYGNLLQFKQYLI